MTTHTVQVTNGTATIQLQYPPGTSARTLTVETTYQENNQYTSDTQTSTLRLNKPNITFTPISATYNEATNELTITGQLYDEFGNTTRGSSQVAIKLNGKTIISGVSVTGGVVDLACTTEGTLSQSTSYPFQLVVGSNNRYNSLRQDMTLEYISQPQEEGGGNVVITINS